MRLCVLASSALAVLALSATTSECVAQKTPAATAPPVYSSPQEVFEAFRQAQGKQDWRTEFFCFTPEYSDELVLEAYVSCAMNPDKSEVLAVRKRFGVEPSVVEKRYYDRYQEKHGVDIRKLKPEGRPPLRQQPPTDERLFRTAVIDSVTDKPMFYIATQKLFAGPTESSRFGKLEQPAVLGDSATGSSTVVSFHIESTSANENETVASYSTYTIRFRKSHGGWLIAGVQWSGPQIVQPSPEPRSF